MNGICALATVHHETNRTEALAILRDPSGVIRGKETGCIAQPKNVRDRKVNELLYHIMDVLYLGFPRIKLAELGDKKCKKVSQP